MILKIKLFYSAVNYQQFEEAKYVCSFVIIIDSSLFTFSLSFSFNGSWGCDCIKKKTLECFLCLVKTLVVVVYYKY